MNDLIPADMSDASMWALIVGFFSPIVLKFIVNKGWTKTVKALVAFAFSAVAGGVAAFFSGAYEGLGIPSAALLSVVVAITSYQNFWKQVGVTNRGTDEVTPHV